MPQELAIYPLLTARENLEVFGALYGVEPAGARRRACAGRSSGPICKDRAQRADEAVLGRHEAAAEHRLQPAAPADARAARRADRRRRSAEPRAHLRDARRAAAARRVDRPHHASSRGSRAALRARSSSSTTAASSRPARRRARAAGARRVATVRRAPATAARSRGAAAGDSRSTRAGDADGPVQDVGRDVAALLAALTSAGAEVDDLDLAGATLQDVFIALTGRELREWRRVIRHAAAHRLAQLQARSRRAGADVPAADHLLLDLRVGFGNQRNPVTRRTRVAVVDEDRVDVLAEARQGAGGRRRAARADTTTGRRATGRRSIAGGSRSSSIKNGGAAGGRRAAEGPRRGAAVLERIQVPPRRRC